MKALLAVALATVAVASVDAAQIEAGGQVRSRMEFIDTEGKPSDAHVGQRSRAHLSASKDGGVSAFVQWQDVRIWGEETNTLADASGDRIDLHQGYVTFDEFAGQPLNLRLGRQEISLGGQRLVGAVGWTHQGRSFDAARGTWLSGDSKVDLIAARLGDTTAPTAATDAFLYGAYGTLAPLAGTEAFVLLNSADPGTDQITAGARKAGKTGGLTYRVEGAYQTGERGGQDVAAFMAGVRVGQQIGDIGVELWFDHLSGDDDLGDGETKVFDTLFATNHKFYGYADLFLNIPVHTAGRGLQNLALKFDLVPREGWTAAVDLHAFRLAQDTGGVDANLGQEIDVSLSTKYQGVAKISGGMYYVMPGDGMADIGRSDKNKLKFYVMTDVLF